MKTVESCSNSGYKRIITKDDQMRYFLAQMKQVISNLRQKMGEEAFNKLVESIDDYGCIDLKKISDWEKIEKDIIEFLKEINVVVEKIPCDNYYVYKLSKNGKSIYINNFDGIIAEKSPINKYLIMLKEIMLREKGKWVDKINDERQMAMFKEVIGYIDSVLGYRPILDCCLDENGIDIEMLKYIY